MISKPEHIEMLKDNPFLLIRYPPYEKRTDQEWMDHLDGVRGQRAVSFCSSPSYQMAAKEYPGGEEAYWSKFSVGGIGVRPDHLMPFSREQLLSMTYLEIAEAGAKLSNNKSG